MSTGQGGQPGPGYWQATDGNWYAPEQHPDYKPSMAPAPPAPQAPQQGYQPQQRAPQTRAEAKADARASAARAKAMRPWFKKKRIMIPLVLVVIIGISVAASGGGDDDGDGGGNSAEDVLALGRSGTTSGLEVTLVTIEDPAVPQVDTEIMTVEPDPGFRFVGVELSIRNTTDERQTMSSILGLELSDALGQRYNGIPLFGDPRTQLDGDIQPGGLLRGWQFFAVEEDATGLQLRVKGSLTAGGIVFGL